MGDEILGLPRSVAELVEENYSSLYLSGLRLYINENVEQEILK